MATRGVAAPYSPSSPMASPGKTLLESPPRFSKPGGFSKLSLADVEDHLSTAAPSDVSSPPLCCAGTPDGQQHLWFQELEAMGGLHCPALGQAWGRGAEPGFEQVRQRAEVRRQVEYYFSRQNLCKDLYLCSRMDQLGWVSLQEIVQFPRMSRMGVSVEEAAVALADSVVVEVSLDMQHVRQRLLPPLLAAALPGSWEAVEGKAVAEGADAGGAVPQPALPEWPSAGVEGAAGEEEAPPGSPPAAAAPAAKASSKRLKERPRRQRPQRPHREAPEWSQDAAADGGARLERPRTPKTPSREGEGTPMGPPEISAWLRWGYDA